MLIVSKCYTLYWQTSLFCQQHGSKARLVQVKEEEENNISHKLSIFNHCSSSLPRKIEDDPTILIKDDDLAGEASNISHQKPSHQPCRQRAVKMIVSCSGCDAIFDSVEQFKNHLVNDEDCDVTQKDGQADIDT